MYDFMALQEETRILEAELEHILMLLFNGIETEKRFNPEGILAYLKETYPDRWNKKINKK